MHVMFSFLHLGNSLGYESGMMFTTKDQDNDRYITNCSKRRYGGWWYKDCAYANLNGRYASSAVKNSNYIYWYLWLSRTTEALKSTRMMIRQ